MVTRIAWPTTPHSLSYLISFSPISFSLFPSLIPRQHPFPPSHAAATSSPHIPSLQGVVAWPEEELRPTAVARVRRAGGAAAQRTGGATAWRQPAAAAQGTSARRGDRVSPVDGLRRQDCGLPAWVALRQVGAQLRLLPVIRGELHVHSGM